MAETAIAPEQIDRDGADVTFHDCDAGNGNKIANNGKIWLRIWNNGVTGSATVTVTVPGTVDGNAITDKAYALSTGDDLTLPPFDPSIYNNSSGNLILAISGTGAADVDIAAFYQ